MSDSFADYFSSNDVDDGTYKAYRTGQQGSVMNFKLIPAEGSEEPIRYIPYLQPITIELHPATGQLCLLCHSTGMTIFIEGRGLDELAEQIGEKRVKSIHQFDQAKHGTAPNGETAVTGIRVEESS